MKILSNKEYNKLMKMKSDYLDLLWKPLQGAFEKITDDDLLRENGLLNAENERLNNIINKAIEYIEQQYKYEETAKEDYDNLLDILKGDDKDEN